ncbi:short-chain dehydrogenase [Bacillus tianshenii]|uniref:short-chain dehydrogenase n=1 Tax=Sutcliffiella tianshenii TaxID=1463404 RepID=UPI001CD30FB5|nr:short-chain dehydrogenase [Bacillus tianshenii]MCA1318302.1 short-chain dehydrogenase [Bacillus tianshenii]
MKKHALVIGGSGMLADVSLWLAEEGYLVSVVGRNARRMKDLTARSDQINPILVDYKDDKEFPATLERAIEKNGPVDLVVAWIHSVAPRALGHVISAVDKKSGDWSLFHILGSSSDLEEIKAAAKTPLGCSYHQVQLGFVLEGAGSRWLRNDEIARGVINAIFSRPELSVVGVLKPWGKRPQW